MKISKLFHWLYALLMLLPIFAVGVTCAYAIFNKNAYQSYGDKYIQNEQVVNDSNLLIPNNNYSFTPKTYFDNGSIYTNGGKYIFNTCNITDWNMFFSGTTALTPQENENINGFVFYKANNRRLNLYSDNTLVKTIIEAGNIVLNNLNTTIYFNLKEIANWNIGSYTDTFSSNSTYLIQYEVQEISDVFYYSIDKVQDSSLFSWANDSFLNQPIKYIVNLFGMSEVNVIVMFMSYWLSISIIWLCFDLIMYVPLLVHRWIDKGVLE